MPTSGSRMSARPRVWGRTSPAAHWISSSRTAAPAFANAVFGVDGTIQWGILARSIADWSMTRRHSCGCRGRGFHRPLPEEQPRLARSPLQGRRLPSRSILRCCREHRPCFVHRRTWSVWPHSVEPTHQMRPMALPDGRHDVRVRCARRRRHHDGPHTLDTVEFAIQCVHGGIACVRLELCSSVRERKATYRSR